jgi:hypothetical protein
MRSSSSLSATIILALFARHLDVPPGTAILNYSLEPEAAQSYELYSCPFDGWQHVIVCGTSTQPEATLTQREMLAPPKILTERRYVPRFCVLLGSYLLSIHSFVDTSTEWGDGGMV